MSTNQDDSLVPNQDDILVLQQGQVPPPLKTHRILLLDTVLQDALTNNMYESSSILVWEAELQEALTNDMYESPFIKDILVFIKNVVFSKNGLIRYETTTTGIRSIND